MRYLVLLLLFSCSINQNKNDAKSQPDQVVLLSSFQATFMVGDESVDKYRLKVYHRGKQVWADKLLPNYYYGNKTDSIWRVQLSNAQIELCNSFLKKAKSLSKECPHTLTGVFFNGIITETDTLRIDGECDWGNVSYRQLEVSFFKKQFEDLRKKRDSLEASLTGTFNGRWYLTPASGELKRGDKLLLSKEAMPENGRCFWEFAPEYVFKSGCSALLAMPYSNKYRLDIDEGDVSLHIEGGFVQNKDSLVEMANEGANFIIESVHENKIVLSFLWR
ncbi:MAG: hypothetical protein ICV83_00530 [Cytophagales bacterium]|nr:hypothetical protein [Cytophagales bacterium]